MIKMPEPRAYETKDEFISRCLSVLKEEGKGINESISICTNLWNRKKRRK